MTTRIAGFVECAAGCGTLVRPSEGFSRMCVSCGSDVALMEAKRVSDAERARALGPHSEIDRIDVGVGEYLPDGPGLRDVHCLAREATWRQRAEVSLIVVGVAAAVMLLGGVFVLGCTGLWHALVG